MALSIPPHLAFSPGPSTRAILASSKLTSATPENGEKDVYTSLSRVILKWSTRLLIYCSIPSSWRNAVEIEKNRGFCNSNTISTPRKLFCNKHEKSTLFLFYHGNKIELIVSLYRRRLVSWKGRRLSFYIGLTI